MKNKLVIVDYILRNFYKNDFELSAVEAIKRIQNKDQIEAEYIANKNLNSLWNMFVKKIDEHSESAMFPYAVINERSTQRFTNYCTLLKNDSLKTKRLKLKLSRRAKIYEFIESLTWREYEAISVLIMEFVGAKDTRIHLTDPGNEFGVDFLALIPSYGKYHLFPNKTKTSRIIGQSKKWKTKTPRERISLLNDALTDFKRRRLEFIDKFPSWIFSSKNSIHGLVFSHSGFQSGARDLANDYGITIGNSYDLTEIISHHFEVDKTPDRIIEILKDRLNDILN
ncbi:MAG: hypothetical protein C0592_10805 [Marinilabiliales bacterium]|nr:MAG: hypothetical protein C0592_10805 [Marinilabiliales bacterium]